MINKKNQRGKKTISLFEIFVLVISIVAFSYFVGAEFKLVSANRATDVEKKDKEESKANPTDYIYQWIPFLGTLIPKDQTPPVIPPETTTPVDPTTTTTTGGIVPPTDNPFWASTELSLANIIGNLAVAFALYSFFSTLDEWTSLNPQYADQLALWISIGYGVGSAVAITATALLGTSAGFLGAGISVGGLFVIPYVGIIAAAAAALICIFGGCKDARYQAVVFNCLPWQPETGGADCQKCNQGQFPCTKYKCQSLGQSCELLNPGTSSEICDWVNRNDIAAPTISSWDGVLPDGYEYTPDSATLPPDRGVIINYEGSSDGCIPPFAKLTYGISLDKPGRCKMDVNVRANNYESMTIPISNGLYKYNHTLLAFHGGVTEAETEGFNIPNGGNYEVFIRCESRNGYANDGTFIFKYCVSDEPDRTAPEIMLTDPLNGWPIAFGQIQEEVHVYTDKPADCRWSHADEDYDLMANTMACDQSITQVNANLLYECTTTLTGLLDGVDNKFYFRCKSYPGNPEEERYKNEESYVYTLIGTRPLVIDYVRPASGTTISDATDSVKVTLESHTSAGFKNGESICFFKESTRPDTSYVQFVNTNSQQHSQELWFTEGGYDYSVRCCDLGGNCDVEETSFIVDTDRDAPIVTRVFNDNQKLKIITNEEAECVYDMTDCTYNFEDGVAMVSTNKEEHTIDWNTNSYFYIKCKDTFANEPFPNQCSIIARPFTSF